jgi:hypothetical protein
LPEFIRLKYNKETGLRSKEKVNSESILKEYKRVGTLRSAQKFLPSARNNNISNSQPALEFLNCNPEGAVINLNSNVSNNSNLINSNNVRLIASNNRTVNNEISDSSDGESIRRRFYADGDSSSDEEVYQNTFPSTGPRREESTREMSYPISMSNPMPFPVSNPVPKGGHAIQKNITGVGSFSSILK